MSRASGVPPSSRWALSFFQAVIACRAPASHAHKRRPRGALPQGRVTNGGTRVRTRVPGPPLTRADVRTRALSGTVGNATVTPSPRVRRGWRAPTGALWGRVIRQSRARAPAPEEVGPLPGVSE